MYCPQCQHHSAVEQTKPIPDLREIRRRRVCRRCHHQWWTVERAVGAPIDVPEIVRGIDVLLAGFVGQLHGIRRQLGLGDTHE